MEVNVFVKSLVCFFVIQRLGMLILLSELLADLMARCIPLNYLFDLICSLNKNLFHVFPLHYYVVKNVNRVGSPYLVIREGFLEEMTSNPGLKEG